MGEGNGKALMAEPPLSAPELLNVGHDVSQFSDFNPIEQAFAIFKRQRQFSGKDVAELIALHYY